MKTLKYILSLALVCFIGCAEDDNDLSFVDKIEAPTNVSALFKISQDNSGLVSITPNSDGAVLYNITFGDDTEAPESVKQGESLEHAYAEGTYTVHVEAVGLNGLKASVSKELVVSFKAPENLDVVIENDVAVSKKVNITANADFAVMFEFYSGEDGVTQPVATANIGETASYIYENPGTYDVKVVVKGAAIETAEYTETFEVTEILAPIAPAPTQQNRAEEDVISIYSSVYNDVPDTDYFPDWGQGGQGSSWAEFDLDGDTMLQYINLSYQGIAFADGTTVDVSGMEFLHLDVWTSGDASRIETSIINNASGTVTEAPVWSDLTAGEWTSIEIPISDYTDQGLTVTEIFQMKFVGDPWAAGTVFIDNIYFYKQSAAPFNDGLLTNGDFETGTDPWIVGVDDNSPIAVVSDSGNTYYSANVTAAGNPWDVNMSQKVNIIQDETYTLVFDAWSDTNRAIVSGIGLSAAPWSSTTESVSITPVKTRYSLTLVAAGFGASDARVIFDMGAEAGMVNIDNVSLFLGDGPFDDGILTNGDFEAGSDPWIVGVDDNSPIAVVTDSGNTYYSTEVASAGNPWDVNMSQKVEITQGVTYTLTFDAWSDTNRTIVSGIGLSGAPWSSNTESISITPTRTTYTQTLEATDFGAVDARVIFDMGAEIGQVNIDNVSLTSN